MGSYRCPACWPVARQILRVAVLIVCLGVSLLAPRVDAQSLAPRPQNPGSAAQTIDASHSFVVDLDGPWRIHDGDDPNFADPALDDSSWPLIRAHQPFHPSRTPSASSRYYNRFIWVRIHLRLPTAAGPLALAVYPDWMEQYEVFVNGSRIASTQRMANPTLGYEPPFPVALPQSGDIVLAVRFYCGPFDYDLLRFPRVSIGSSGSIQSAIELDHLRALNNGTVANCVCFCICMLVGITAMILYRTQRDHDEYLWLGIATLMLALANALYTAIQLGWLPYSFAVAMAGSYASYIFNAAQIEFVVRFTRTRRNWPIWIVQGFMLIAPLLFMFTLTMVGYRFMLVIGLGLFLAAEIACFVSAYRRGVAESRLLLIPALAAQVLNLAWGAATAYPNVVPWRDEFRFGVIGISVNYLGYMLFCLGIAAVVLYRFIRVARDEAHAAGELEAARTVQQVLVPEHIPTIPGFAIEAVYHPAGQVGGDFYQIIPTASGGVLIAIGDVSGKGMPAAMTVSLLVGTVRTTARYTHNPAEILCAMNEGILGRSNGGFTTAMVLRIDDDGTLTVANAGHLAPYSSGRELSIENGLPLGLASDVEYKETRLQLSPGDTLTLLSDGVVEAQSESGELFGFERTAAISHKPAEKVAQAARAFGQQDDITVVTLALEPAAALQA